MSHALTVTAAALTLAVTFSPAAIAAGDSVGKNMSDKNEPSKTGTSTSDKVLVVDAPDLRRTRTSVTGPRFTQLVGEEVYSNSGKRIGEIEDFVMSRGEVYAVVDTSDGPLEELVNLGDQEMVLLSARELRRATLRDGRFIEQSGRE